MRRKTSPAIGVTFERYPNTGLSTHNKQTCRYNKQNERNPFLEAVRLLVENNELTYKAIGWQYGIPLRDDEKGCTIIRTSCFMAAKDEKWSSLLQSSVA